MQHNHQSLSGQRRPFTCPACKEDTMSATRTKDNSIAHYSQVQNGPNEYLVQATIARLTVLTIAICRNVADARLIVRALNAYQTKGA